MFAQNPFGDAVMVGGAITAADPNVSITAIHTIDQRLRV
eukprot:COSAG01_NODE_3410_length_6127_cov_11.612807_2_plen_39_part_00